MTKHFDPIRPYYEKQLIAAYNHFDLNSYKQIFDKLNEGVLTFKDIRPYLDDISYKKINDWDAKGLIGGTRENKETGWRRFSAVDLIKFFIISDLREIGLDIDEIAAILSKLNKYPLQTPAGLIQFPQMNFFIYGSINKATFLLLLDHNKTPYFLTEDDAVKFHFLRNFCSPVIILPFYLYASRIVAARKPEDFLNNKTSIKELLATNLTTKEIELIKLLRDKEYRQITLIKSDGDTLQIKTKSINQGKFSDIDILNAVHKKDYQKITIVKKDGQNVVIEQEESIRV